MVTARTLTLFKANTKETTKAVARPKAAPPLLWWRPQAATFVLALNSVNIVAVTTILVFQVGNGRFEHVRLDIMFRAVRASCSLAVRAMRACAQGGHGTQWFAVVHRLIANGHRKTNSAVNHRTVSPDTVVTW